MAAVLTSMPAIAHRGHDGLTVVTIEKGGKVTVSHRFEAHDLEPVLARITPDAQPSLDDPEAVQGFVGYLNVHFRLMADGTPIALQQQSFNAATNIVQVDFVGKLPVATRALSITNTLFGGLRARQVNQVNVRRGNVVRTMTFTGAATQRIALR